MIALERAVYGLFILWIVGMGLYIYLLLTLEKRIKSRSEEHIKAIIKELLSKEKING